MLSNLVSDRPPLVSLLRILGLVLIGFVVIGPVLGVAVASLFYDGDFLQAFADPVGHPDIRNSILLSQGIAALVGLVLLPWYYIHFSEHRSLAAFFKKEPSWALVIISVMVGTIGLGLSISPVVEWNAEIQFPEWMGAFDTWVHQTEALAESIVTSITSNLTPEAFAFAFLVVAVLPAVGEELVFRGFIQTELHRALKNPHLAIWISAILFSAFHLQFLGFVPRTLIGAFLGYLYYWSGNLWVPVLGHFFNNGMQLVVLYLHQLKIISFDVESTESAPLPMVIIACVLTILLLVFYKNYFFSRSTAARDLTEEL